MDPIQFSLPITKAWGFFNNVHNYEEFGVRRHKAPYITRSLSDERLLLGNDNPYWQQSIGLYYLFETFWRFDVLRPLYGGLEEWGMEFLFLIGSPLIIVYMLHEAIRFFFQAFHQHRYLAIPPLILLMILSILYATLLAALSVVFSFLGIIIRPVITGLFGIEDKPLTVQYTCYCEIHDENELYVTYGFLKEDGFLVGQRMLKLKMGSCAYDLSIPLNNYNLVEEKFWFKENCLFYQVKSQNGEIKEGFISKDQLETFLRKKMQRRIFCLQEDENPESSRFVSGLRWCNDENRLEYEGYIEASERTVGCW